MAETHYIWDMSSDSYLLEKDETGATSATYTNEPVPFGKLISQRRETATTYFHFDVNGSTTNVTDQDQNVAETATYSGFGEIVDKSSSVTNPFGFIGSLGYYAIPGMDNLYVRARFYEPKTGRWLSTDPAMQLRQTNDLYSYVRNRPTQLNDPSGMIVVPPERRCSRPGSGTNSICVCIYKPAATPGEGIVQVCFLVIVGIGIATGLDRCFRRRKYRCTTKARNWPVGSDCYGQIFAAEGTDEATTRQASWQACVDAGCHQPGRGGDCGHITCTQTN